MIPGARSLKLGDIYQYTDEDLTNFYIVDIFAPARLMRYMKLIPHGICDLKLRYSGEDSPNFSGKDGYFVVKY